VAQHGDSATLDRRETGEHRFVVPEDPVTVERDDVREETVEVVLCLRTIGVPRDLDEYSVSLRLAISTSSAAISAASSGWPATSSRLRDSSLSSSSATGRSNSMTKRRDTA
jgi:hypothetical protein